MVLLAKRVKAKREPVKIASTSSADEKRRIRSKISAASSLVSIPEFPVETRLAASPPPPQNRRPASKDGPSPVSANTPSRREYSGTGPDSPHVPCPQPAAADPCRSLEFPTASTRRASRSHPSNSKTPW